MIRYTFYGIDQTLTVAAAAGDAIKEFDLLRNAMSKTGKAIAEFTNITRTFNDEGVVLTQTMTGVTEAGEKVSRTYTRNEQVFHKTKESFTAAEKVLNKYTEAVENFKKTGELSDDVMRNRIKLLARLGKEQEANQKIIDRLNKDYDKQNGTVKTSNSLLDEAIGLAKEEERVQRNRIKVLAELQRLQAAERNQNAATAFRAGVATSMPMPSDATASQISSMQSALATASKFIESGKISPERLQAIFDHVRSGATDFAALTVSEARAETALRRYVTAYANTGEKVQSITISWQGVLRLLEAQLLHIAFGRIFANFKQSIDDAAQLSIRIAEIQTISQKSNMSTEAWTKSLRALSEAFGEDVLVTAEAAYETISNQIAKGANAAKFMHDAMEFSQAAVTDAANAVNLLSSAINAYGKSTNDTRQIAAIFFKTIDLGRLRAEDIANTFGNVATLAAQMGVSLKEVGAALATLTKQGVQPDTAMTLLTNTLKSLLKPTKEMKALLKEYGFASGQAAIQTVGFVGVLKILEKELATGGTTRIAELDDDLRELRGTLGLVNKSAFADFQDALAQMSNGTEEYDKAVKLVAESVGKQWNRELTKAANIMKIDMGQHGLQSVLKMIDAMGGLDNVLRRMLEPFAAIGKTLELLITGFGLLNHASDETKDAVGQLVVAMTELYLVNRLLSTDKFAWIGSAKGRILSLLATIELVNIAYSGMLGANGSAQKKFTDARSALDKAAADSLNDKLTGQFEAFNKELVAANTNTKDLSDALEERLNKSLTELKDKQFDKSLKKVRDAIVDIHNALMDRQAEVQNNAFGADPLAGGFEAISREYQRLQELSNKALNEGDFDRARQFWDDMVSKVEKYNDLIQNSLNESLKETRDIMQQIDERSLDKALAGKSAGDQIGILKQHIATLTGQAMGETDIEKARKLFDQVEDDIKRIEKLEADFNKKAKAAGMGGLATDRAGELTDKLLQDRLNKEEAFRKSLPNKVDEEAVAEQRIKFEERIQNALEFQNKAIEAKNALLEKQRELTGQILDLNNSIATAEKNRLENIKSGNAAANDANTQISGVGAALKSMTDGRIFTPGAVDDVIDKIQKLDAAKASHNIETIEKALEDLNKALAEYRKWGDSQLGGKNIFGNSIDITGDMNVDQSIAILTDNIKKYQDALNNLRESEKQASAIDEAKQKVAKLQEEYNNLINSIQGLPNVQGQATNETIKYINQITAAIQQLSDAVKGVPPISVPIRYGADSAPGHATGGLLHGPPGRDNMFIRAHSGEFVVNTAATQKFYSQLVAMNAGFSPRGFASGGGVSIHGGINVSVTGTPSTEQTARELGQAIRRGIRNRTIRLS